MARIDIIKELLSFLRLLMSGLFGSMLLTALYIYQNTELQTTLSLIHLFIVALTIALAACFKTYLNYVMELGQKIDICHATAELKRWEKSLAIIIPKDKIDELGLSEHDIIDIDIAKKETVSGFGIARGKAPFQRDRIEHDCNNQ